MSCAVNPCGVAVLLTFPLSSNLRVGFRLEFLLRFKVLFVFVDYFNLIGFHFVWHLSFTFQQFNCVLFGWNQRFFRIEMMYMWSIVDGPNAIYWIPIQMYRMCLCVSVFDKCEITEDLCKFKIISQLHIFTNKSHWWNRASPFGFGAVLRRVYVRMFLSKNQMNKKRRTNYKRLARFSSNSRRICV